MSSLTKMKKIHPRDLKLGQFCKYGRQIYQKDDDDCIQQLTGKEKGKPFCVNNGSDWNPCPQKVTPIKVKITEVK